MTLAKEFFAIHKRLKCHITHARPVTAELLFGRALACDSVSIYQHFRLGKLLLNVTAIIKYIIIAGSNWPNSSTAKHLSLTNYALTMYSYLVWLEFKWS